MKTVAVHIQTSDGMSIAGSYIPGTAHFGAVLVHMMPATRASFDALAQMLAATGLHTLAIDLRGHGDSSGGDYQKFTNEQHQKAILDVLASVDFLKRQDPEMGVGFVGASIGASLCMQYCAANPAEFLALLSPGLNYRGMEAGRLAIALPEDLPVYVVSAQDDSRVEGNAAQAQTIFNSCASRQKIIRVFPEGGHGTEITARNPDFARELTDWARNSCADRRQAEIQSEPTDPENDAGA